MVCEQLNSFLSQEERAREEASGRKQEGTPSVSEEWQEKLVNQQEREAQRLQQGKYLDPTSSQKDLKVCLAKQSVNSQLWAPDTST